MLDRAARMLYYMPPPGADLSATEFVAPVLRTLISVRAFVTG